MRYSPMVLAVLVIANGCGPSQAEYDSAQAEIQRLRAEIADLRNTPTQRLSHARDLLTRGSTTAAEREFAELASRFPASPEARIARTTADSLGRVRETAEREASIRAAEAERERAAQAAETERRRRLGFRGLPERSSASIADVRVRANVKRAHRWIMDYTQDVEEYHYRDAERGADFVLADLTITAEGKDPILPPIYVYSIAGDHLSLVGTMKFEFKRWRSYGGYLGNYADYTNDFAHTSTIPFVAGLEVSNEILAQPLFVLLGHTPCVSRSYSQYGSPKVSYESGGCTPPSSLTLDYIQAGYTLIRVLNRSKL